MIQLNTPDANGWTLLDGANGERYISAVRLKTATVAGATQQVQFIFLRELRALAGAFKCLHASCAHRDDGDFLNAIGIRNDDFEDLTSIESGGTFTAACFRA